VNRVFEKFMPARFRSDRTVVPVVPLNGAITGQRRLGSGMSLATVEDALKRAFAFPRAPLVAIAINSPGGLPVQSHLIHTRIRALAAEHERQVIVGIEDVAASGGYLIALAGDEIVAHGSSIVGSIGVIHASFGFHEAISRIGVERRVHTAGESKSILDPFRPEKPEDVVRLKAIQEDMYEDFVALVKARRGDALAEGEEDLFSGAFWSGKTAHGLGLVDRVGDLRTVLRERYGDGLRLRVFPTERKPLLRRFGVDAGSGYTRLVTEIAGGVEERALWSRYGL